MKIEKIAVIKGGQDGAIYGSELFRFDARGNCRVYDLSALKNNDVTSLEETASFRLDRCEELAPHSNAVCFGCEFYDRGDEYPLLYTNIYNNYARNEDKLTGVCLVYRIFREGEGFGSQLVQMIEIGFTEDSDLWKAYPDRHGVRPYGNFLVDTDTRSYWGFVMRNEELGTRYFRFDLPSVHQGETDARYGIKRVVLAKEDIREYFDCGYHHYIQGAILRDGKIYSTEGFTNDERERPAIRIIDLGKGAERYFDIMSIGYPDEAEFIDFYKGQCLYGDAHGALYRVEFDG